MVYFIFILNAIFDVNIFILNPFTDKSKSDCDKQAKNDLDLQGFEIIYKTPHNVSSELITITSCWITKTSIQVGNLITFNATVASQHYIENITQYKNITLKFHHYDMNYWYEPYKKQNKYVQTNKLVLHPDNISKTFTADKPINLRFTVPHNIAIDYCEYTTEEKCFPIQNLLQPAPYHLKAQTDANNLLASISIIVIGVNIALLIVSIVGIVYTKRGSSQHTVQSDV